jgi:Lon protease-like protein
MENPPASSALELAVALVDLPLFPLPEVTLFPGALVPLHIFEPRYRALVRDVLATHRSFALVQLADPPRVDAEGQPVIARIAGVGTIVDHAELPSGRFNLLVRGRARVVLDELPFRPPYRRARADLAPDDDVAPTRTEVDALRATAASFAALVRAKNASIELRLPLDVDPSELAFRCAHQLVVDARERQRILEATSASERVRLVTEALALQHLGLAGPSDRAPN